MTYNPSIPNAGDFISISQGQIFNNFAKANSSFGTDHYAFSDLTANNGFHNQMTTPLIVGGVHPTTVAAIPKMYAMQDTVHLGVLNYSRGPSNAVPTPITSLHSTVAALVLAPGGTTNVLDFTGLARAFCIFCATDTGTASSSIIYYIVWSGTAFTIINLSSNNSFLAPQVAGNILQLKNITGIVTLNNVYWTLELLRTT